MTVVNSRAVIAIRNAVRECARAIDCNLEAVSDLVLDKLLLPLRDLDARQHDVLPGADTRLVRHSRRVIGSELQKIGIRAWRSRPASSHCMALLGVAGSPDGCFWPVSGVPACVPNRPGLGVKQTCSGHVRNFRV